MGWRSTPGFNTTTDRDSPPSVSLVYRQKARRHRGACLQNSALAAIAPSTTGRCERALVHEQLAGVSRHPGIAQAAMARGRTAMPPSIRPDKQRTRQIKSKAMRATGHCITLERS